MDRYDELDPHEPGLHKSGPNQVGEFDPAQGKRDRAPRPRRQSLLPWALLALVLGAGAGFGGFVYLPEHEENQRLRQRIGQLDESLIKLKAELQAVQDAHKELEAERTRLAETVQSKDEALDELTKTQKDLSQQLQAEISKGDVLIKSVNGELVVDLVDQLMFSSGEAELNDSGKEVLRKVGQTLLDAKDKVLQVAGNTDNLPITGKLKDKFPSNWELSTTRATNVVRFLQDECKIPGARLAAVGYAEFRPSAKNTSKDGRKKNRRIEVKLVPINPPLAAAAAKKK
jgi:chemotaxis protein MotB